MKNKKFENTINGVKCSFEVPENPTIMERLAYESKRLELEGVDAGDKLPMFVILWESAKEWIRNWNCDYVPDLGDDFMNVYPDRESKTKIDPADFANVATVVKWAGLQVSIHWQETKQVSKN